MANKKVGIIGSGQVAQVLSAGFVKHGYQVMVGSRDITKLNEWKSKTGANVKIGNLEEVAAFGDILVLSVKGSGAELVIRKILPHLKGKIVIDTTNPIADAPPDNGIVKYFTDLNSSLMEKLQQLAPDAHFVKAFNSVGNALMVNPKLPGGKPTMFICGNNDAAKKEVTTILDQFGWETEDMGKVQAARSIEPLCILWCIPGFLRNDWVHAFKVLRP
jgi:8-hydroxy-5-deazaflavin:NADPH oxidoreductase